MAEEESFPAQLHEEYLPPVDRKKSKDSQPYHGDAGVDIVLVHGLGSKYMTTWAYKRKDRTRYHWIREKLPQDVPDARILGFEYPSRWYDDPVHIDLRECAAQLLRCLIRDRCHRGEQTMCRTRRKRPIIFVGHSFGGLVIKKAMVMASQVLSSNASSAEYENHRDLLSSIAGVVFLGTPHRGSSFALLAGLKIGFGRYVMRVSSNDEIVTILKPDSYVLDDLQDEFSTLCWDERMSGLKLFCYYEMKEVSVLRKRVVPMDSACLDNAACRGMDATHMDMNTFGEGPDNDYDHFISDIRMISLECIRTIPKRFDAWRYGSDIPDFDRERLQRSLDPSRDAPTTTFLKKLEKYQSAPYTCQWIHGLSEFTNWKSGTGEQNALWISGKAGSGKSVMAAYIINKLLNEGKEMSQDGGGSLSCKASVRENTCGFRRNTPPVLYLFAGVDRAHDTPERILATLIHQLLLSQAENQKLFQEAQKLYRDNLTGASSSVLAEKLLSLLRIVGTAYIILDSVEEIPAAETFLEMLAILRPATETRILILSQETKEVAHALSSNFNIESPLLITDHSEADIIKFIQAKGAELTLKKPQLKEKESLIMQSLQDRAQGMFQWVNAALEHLRYIDDPKDTESSLNGIRGELVDTYENIFKRFAMEKDDERQLRIQTSLQFLAVSATSVSPIDIKFAYLIKQRPDETLLSLLNSDCQKSTEFSEKEIRNLLGSVVDICSDGTAQFQHPSMLRALTRVESASDNPVTAKFKFTLEEAHAQMCEICLAVCRATSFVHANAFTHDRPPLVEYAWNYWAYHLNLSKKTFVTSAERDHLKKLATLNPEFMDSAAKQMMIQNAFDKMIDGVSRDVLLYLEALVDSLCRPLKAVAGRFSDREYVLSLQRAQESLIEPTQDLCSLRRMLPLSYKVQDTRKWVVNYSSSGSPQPNNMSRINGAMDTVSDLKSKVMGGRSSVSRLFLDDHLKDNPQIPRPSQSLKLLLDIARKLRFVALRFSVDPIYSSLLSSAGGSSFSPLHPLIYAAQLFEESGRYPYWEALPPATDLMEYFICQADDPEYAPAKFVLHCFEWREHHARDDKKDTGHYVRTAQAITVRPSPSGRQFTRVSTENWEQVKRLHQVNAEKFWAARFSYRLFESENSMVKTFILNPLANAHIKYGLLFEEHSVSEHITTDYNQVLNAYSPEEVEERPMTTFLKSIPYLFRVYLVEYAMYLFEVFGRLARQVMATHFARIETAITELTSVAAFVQRVYSPGDLPRVPWWYFIPGFLFYLLRCRYFPSWGAHLWFHSWSKFSYAYKHPATYIDLQNSFGFWELCGSFFSLFIYTFLYSAAITTTVLPETNKNMIGHFAFAYSAFHCFCTVDRSLFAISASLATFFACASLMMHDMETVTNIFKGSLLFWFSALVTPIISAIQLGVIENGGSWYAIIGSAFLQMALWFILIFYHAKILTVLLFIFKPVTITAMFIWRNALFASVFAAKLIGGVALAVLVLKAMRFTHKFIWDPYDIEDSLKKLLDVSRSIKSSLTIDDTKQLKRIGWYPLGEKEARLTTNLVAESLAETGPPRARIPLHEVRDDFQEALTEGVGNVKQYFEDGTWKSHMVQISDLADKAAIGLGDHIADAVDAVGERVARGADGLGDQVTKVWADGAKQLRNLRRNDDHMKLE